jgi:hypothetical protein
MLFTGIGLPLIISLLPIYSDLSLGQIGIN